ncbi:MAG: hypothetical protein WC781_02090 [Candidatus Pacearchaeota archaeon]|jgi:hypothetical protein
MNSIDDIIGMIASEVAEERIVFPELNDLPLIHYTLEVIETIKGYEWRD